MFVLFYILKAIITIVVVIIVLTLLLLITNFNYKLKVNINEEITGFFKLEFLFNILKIEAEKLEQFPKLKFYILKLKVFSKEINFSNVKKDKKVKEKKKALKNEKDKKGKMKKFLDKYFLNKTKEFFIEILNIIKPNKFEIKGVYGFEDPFITGIICAIIPLIPFGDIKINPNFEDDDTDITIVAHGKISIIVIGYKALRLILDKKIRKIIFSKN